MRSGPRSLPRQIYSQQHDLTLLGLLLLDLPTIVSLLLLLGSLIPVALILTLGYLPVYFGRIVFTRAEMPLLLLAGFVVLLAGPAFLWRVNHFRRILRFTVLVPGQIRRLSITAFEFRVDYVYWFQQRAYNNHNAIRRNHRRERRASLRPGQPIISLVDKFQPEASIVLDLYTDKNHSN